MPSTTPDGLARLQTFVFTPQRLRYVQDWDDSVVSSIDFGVLFLMAWWSGPSIMHYRLLMETLQAADASDVEVIVVDVDGAPTRLDVPGFRGPFGGNGETAWIVGGKVVASTFGIVAPGVFTRKLTKLRAPDAPEPEPSPAVSLPRRLRRSGLRLAGLIQIIAGIMVTAAGLAAGSPAAGWGIIPIGIGVWMTRQSRPRRRPHRMPPEPLSLKDL